MSLFQRLLSAIKDFFKEIWGKLSDEEKEKIIKLIANSFIPFIKRFYQECEKKDTTQENTQNEKQ